MISLNWVKDYIDINDLDPNELSVKVTKAGINVEKVISNNIENLKTGQVISCIPHPNSDHLHICQVDVGDKQLQIVCGAPNVRENLKVITALEGAVLKGGFEIKKTTIRGIESHGMLCALFELGLEEENEENYSKGIYELPQETQVGTNPLTILGLDDTIYELDVHKHRNNDCYYHIGFAYELSAILGRKVTLPIDSYHENNESINKYLSLDVQTNNCPYYLAKMATNIKIKESPDFIKKRLNSIGIRSINNVVDISNYVMMEYGQPMHFFDYNTLGNKIVVRTAKDKEKIITLDKKERILSTNDIVITDGEKPVCIAGIMGGENTEVENTTNTIVIESAIFAPSNIRTTSLRLDLKSEASIHYGKGLNYEYTKKAIDRACYLLEKYADATIIEGMLIHDTINKKEKIVEFTKEDINKLIGITFTKEDIINELKKLDFPYTLTNETFNVTIPNRRLDIDPNINDIAEEIARLYGYDNLTKTLPKVSLKKGEYKKDVQLVKDVQNRLRNLSLNECKTYTLTSEKHIQLFNYDNKEIITLPNPMSNDKKYVRVSILPSLIDVYNYNKARKVSNINIYEVSKTYDKYYNEDIKVAILIKGNYLENSFQSKIKCDFYILKGIIENLLNYLGFKNRYEFVKEEINNLHKTASASIYLDKEKIGIIGRIDPSIMKDDIFVSELSLTKIINKNIKPLKYKEPIKYPQVTKDCAFIVDNNIPSIEIEKIIKKEGSRLLNDVKVFDVYTVDDNKKSIAYSLSFQDPTKTLSEEEVMEVFNRIIEKVKTSLNATLRDK